MGRRSTPEEPPQERAGVTAGLVRTAELTFLPGRGAIASPGHGASAGIACHDRCRGLGAPCRSDADLLGLARSGLGLDQSYQSRKPDPSFAPGSRRGREGLGKDPETRAPRSRERPDKAPRRGSTPAVGQDRLDPSSTQTHGTKRVFVSWSSPRTPAGSSRPRPGALVGAPEVEASPRGGGARARPLKAQTARPRGGARARSAPSSTG